MPQGMGTKNIASGKVLEPKGNLSMTPARIRLRIYYSLSHWGLIEL